MNFIQDMLEAWLREDYYPPDWDDRGGDWWDEAEDGPRPV